jgi:hypothetical protein
MSQHSFEVYRKKIKNLYKVNNDGTSIDNLVIDLKNKLGSKISEISVKGASSGLNEFDLNEAPYAFKQVALLWKHNDLDKITTRQYYVKIYLNHAKFKLKICNMNFISGSDPSSQPGTEKDFIYNRDKAFDLISPIFKEHSMSFCVSTFCGIIPTSIWSERTYIKVVVDLPIDGHDVFIHSSINNISDFGVNNINEIRDEFISIANNEIEDISDLFVNKKRREIIARRAENNIRKKHGIKNVGDSFINETLLANYITELFPDTIRQYNTKWLGRFLIDIYIPSLRIAIEYHGEQHYKPIDRFGGEEKFKKQQVRDEFVRNKCKENNVLLLEWSFKEIVTKKSVMTLISQHVKISDYEKPLNLFD